MKEPSARESANVVVALSETAVALHDIDETHWQISTESVTTPSTV